LLATFVSGCGTLSNQEGDRKPYGGVVNIYRAATFKDPPHGLTCGPLFFLDMPFSFVGDTLLLPFDAYYRHQVRVYQESPRRFPPDPDPLAGWKHTPDVQPDPVIVADYESYIEQLPQDQRKVLIVNPYMVRVFEDGKGAHAMEIRLLLKDTEWKHVLIYDESNRRVKVMKYARRWRIYEHLIEHLTEMEA